MTTIDEAASLLTALADDLTSRLHARGYPKARAMIWFGHNDTGPHIFINNEPPGFPYLRDRHSLAESLTFAKAAIETAPDLSGMAAWFDMAQVEVADVTEGA